MASISQPVAVKPVPKSATIATVNGRRVAQWVARGGKKVSAPLTADGRKVRVKSPTWWIEYRDATGTRQRRKGFRDRAATMQLASTLEQQARSVRAGVEPPQPTDGPAHLIDVIPVWRDHMTRKGDCDHHVNTYVSRATAVILGCSLTTPAAVDAEAVERWLDAEGKRKDWSAETRNKWATALTAFGNHLMRTKRSLANPFAGLARLNVAADRRLTRRALGEDEFLRLVAATEAGTDLFDLSGPDRAMLYVVAAYTGRRLGTLLKMTPEAFTWEGGVPVASVSSARLQKSGKPHTVPLHPALSAELAGWLADKPAGQPLWSGLATLRYRGARMLRHDLAAAGLEFADAAGEVFDFHALRGQFLTSLARAGVGLAAAQKLADHSTPALTANVYTKLGRELAGEVAKLPGFRRVDPGAGVTGGVTGPEKKSATAFGPSARIG